MSDAGDWGHDMLYFLRGAATMYLNNKPPKRYLANAKKGKAPVVLIPGIFYRWGAMKGIADRLSGEGHAVYIVPGLGHNMSGIEKSAALVRNVIDHNNLRRVALVCHSKGGLIGKYILVHHNEDKRIKMVIALATPFSGSLFGLLVPNKTGVEFLPTGKIMRDLHSHPEVNKMIYAVTPTYNDSIDWLLGNYLPGSKKIEVETRGHNKMLWSEEVEDKVSELLLEFDAAAGKGAARNSKAKR